MGAEPGESAPASLRGGRWPQHFPHLGFSWICQRKCLLLKVQANNKGEVLSDMSPLFCLKATWVNGILANKRKQNGGNSFLWSRTQQSRWGLVHIFMHYWYLTNTIVIFNKYYCRIMPWSPPFFPPMSLLWSYRALRVNWHGQGHFIDGVKVTDPEVGRLPWISWWTQSNHLSPENLGTFPGCAERAMAARGGSDAPWLGLKYRDCAPGLHSANSFNEWEVALPWGLQKGRQPCQCLDVSLVRPCQDLTDRIVGKYVCIAVSHRVGGNVLQQQ